MIIGAQVDVHGYFAVLLEITGSPKTEHETGFFVDVFETKNLNSFNITQINNNNNKAVITNLMQ